jgi:uncharacterized protein (DUF488 family)
VTVYTFGYQGRTVGELRDEAERLKATVIDTRLVPASRVTSWRTAFLSKTLPRYRWVGEFGNRNFRGGAIEIADFEGGALKVADLVASGIPLILLCVCHDAGECHRAVVASRLAALLRCPVEHL